MTENLGRASNGFSNISMFDSDLGNIPDSMIQKNTNLGILEYLTLYGKQ